MASLPSRRVSPASFGLGARVTLGCVFVAVLAVVLTGWVNLDGTGAALSRAVLEEARGEVALEAQRLRRTIDGVTSDARYLAGTPDAIEAVGSTASVKALELQTESMGLLLAAKGYL